MPWGVRGVSILLVIAAALGGVSTGHGAREPAAVELKGEVVDLACYVAHGARGRENAICARQHPTPDQPLALLTGEGELHLLYADHHSAFAYDTCRQRAGESVTLVGVPAERDGLRVLEVREIRPAGGGPKGE